MITETMPVEFRTFISSPPFRIQEIERKIAASKNKLTCHRKKWDNLLEILPGYQ